MCVCQSVNKIPAEGMHRFGLIFAAMVAYRTDSDPNEIGDLWLKVKVTMTQYPFFLHNSLLNYLLWISISQFLLNLKTLHLDLT